MKNFLRERKARLEHKKRRFFKDTTGISYGIHTPLKEIQWAGKDCFFNREDQQEVNKEGISFMQIKG